MNDLAGTSRVLVSDQSMEVLMRSLDHLILPGTERWNPRRVIDQLKSCPPISVQFGNQNIELSAVRADRRIKKKADRA